MTENKTPLTDQELEDFRRRLQEKRRQLTQDLSGAARELKEQEDPDAGASQTDVPTHDADAASDEHDESVTRSAAETDRHIIAEIDEALRRIDAGTYGLCMATGEPIDKRRLEAKPWARYSYDYARRADNCP